MHWISEGKLNPTHHFFFHVGLVSGRLDILGSTQSLPASSFYGGGDMSAVKGEVASVTQLDRSQGKAWVGLYWPPLLCHQQLPKILVTCYEQKTNTKPPCVCPGDVNLLPENKSGTHRFYQGVAPKVLSHFNLVRTHLSEPWHTGSTKDSCMSECWLVNR